MLWEVDEGFMLWEVDDGSITVTTTPEHFLIFCGGGKKQVL